MVRAQPKASHGPADCDCSALGGSAPSLATFPPAIRSKRGGGGQSRFPAATYAPITSSRRKRNFIAPAQSLCATSWLWPLVSDGRVWPASQTMPRQRRGFKVLRSPKTGGFVPCSRTRFLRARDSRSSEPFNCFAVLHFVPAQRVIGSALRLFHPLRKRLRKQGSGKPPNPPHRGGFRLVS